MSESIHHNAKIPIGDYVEYFYGHSYLLPHASMVAHMQNSYSKFHSVMVRKHRLLRSLPTIASWVEFRTWYHDFMTIRAQEWDRTRFQLKGFRATVTIELLLKKELEQKEITIETL